MPFSRKFRIGIFFLAFAASVNASEPSPHDCRSGVAAYSADLEPPFVQFWRREADILQEVKPFNRILMLADGIFLDDSVEIATHYPRKSVVGTDITISRSFFSPSPNLVVSELDIRKPFPFNEGSFDLVYLRSGLCHCRSDTETCCGIEETDVAITHFFSEVIRMLNKKQSHSLAILHGFMPVDFFLKWRPICDSVASHNGFRCVPQVHVRQNGSSLFWGFKIRR
jgi:hypothetical protein